MVALYECTKDILIYCNPCEWLTHHQQFRYMGLMLLWLALHHSLFVKKVQVEEPVSGLHQRFQRDGVVSWGRRA